jgi:2',3'-cyclic-nucleotide 2'-phosphodiesterase (5'-nucleotidase family)
VKDVREDTKAVILLDAGDLLFKKFSAPIPENELRAATQKAQLIIDSFNLMGYDAIGIGDDDLSLGKDFLVEISKKSNCPFLSSNIIDEETGKTLFHPFLLKEVNGLRIGIFSLLSPDLFMGPSDLRKKGLILRPPIETAQSMVKELKPKTDLLILLSHLSYPKDMELAQAVSGIHLIVGGHTGISLPYPPLINNIIVLQTASKGMVAGRLDLTLHSHEPAFYNAMTKRSLENNLNHLRDRLNSAEAPEAEKAQWRKTKEELERTLAQFQGKNEFTNTILPLSEQMKEHPDIGKMVEAYKIQLPAAGKQPSPK